MPEQNIKYVLFDAANTLIHKPTLWTSMLSVFNKYGYSVSTEKLKANHKLISEVVDFPDRTSKDFYHYFNAELALSLGVLPTEEILAELFSSCSYLPWQKFSDTEWLTNCKQPIGVLSNFNNSLPNILNELFGNLFSNIIASENLSIRKPDIAFYMHAVEVIGFEPNQILYVGDSLKLDILPAASVGFNAYLIDRLNIYTGFEKRITSFNELNSII